MAGYVQVTTTTATKADAVAIADAALAARQAACVQVVGPIESRYWWGGAIEVAEEWLCLLKTTGDQLDALMTTIGAAHPYETPEIVVTAIVAGSARYLAWIDEVTTSGGRGLVPSPGS